MHELAPAEEYALPPQLLQPAAPAAEKVPGLQLEHCLFTPQLGLNVPAGQDTQPSPT